MTKMYFKENGKRWSKADIGRMTKLTNTDLAAISYIGRHRKSKTYPHRKSCPVSVRTANKLIKRGYVMRNGKSIILTYNGERAFTLLHPYSKWKIS